MKRVFLLIISITLLACSGPKGHGSIEDVAWLAGAWKSDGSKMGMLTKELWSVEGTGMVGKGLVIQNGDTTFVENLALRVINDTLSYVAEVGHNDEPVTFKLTKQAKDRWTFENPAHDFPKSIEYIKTAEGFEALVSGGERSFKLNFRRD